MGLLNAAALASMQATAGLTRTTSCTIQRKAQTSDGAGGYTDAWNTLATVNCRVSPLRRYREDVEQGRIEAHGNWRIALPAGQDVTPADRIVALGITYEVTGVAVRTLEIERICECVVLT